ncbi:tyrosine/serine/threonine protein phosphatase [Sporothrix epigloea]|uniref:Tyrosine/serine/threonine protein phosphatase n=1 Tax=Sporothrix epigloea TaxID=1892477 RepID=A0ABP0DP58_9PEZI
MPSATARRLYEDQIPSLMSVFDLGATMIDDQNTGSVADSEMIDLPDSSFGNKLSSHDHAHQTSSFHELTAPNPLSLDPSHRLHVSTFSQTSESSDSSPTTTMSCTDSSSLSDASPSSSPDSPVNLGPLAAFPGPSFAGFSTMSVGLASLSVIDPSNRLERPMTSPSPRRARNAKGLSIQPPFAMPPPSTTAHISEPVSLSFIKPQIPAMKRKPSHLSLRTTTNDLIKSTTIEVPQSPSLQIQPILQRRALKHSTSSPHILSSLKSSTFGPQGGMTFPTVLERNKSGLSEFLRPSKPAGPSGKDAVILEEFPIRAQIANRTSYQLEPFHENENNEDQKSPCYPDGPIAIYDDNVFLYLEPTAEEASRFDVVINVAREVQNPFNRSPSRISAQTLTQQHGHWQQPPPHPKQSLEARIAVPKLASIPEPDTEAEERLEHRVKIQGTSQISVDSAIPTAIGPVFSTATTAPATSSRLKRKAPSLSISMSLPSATERTKEDDTPTTPKAIPSFKEPEYIHIPWDHNTDIGSDLMKEVNKRRTHHNSRSLPGRSSVKHRAAFSVDAIDTFHKTPLSAPLPTDSANKKDFTATRKPGRSPLRLRGKSTLSSRDFIPPGPSSAPSSFSWDEKDEVKDPKRYGRFDLSPTALQPSIIFDSCGSGLGLPKDGIKNDFIEPLPSPRFVSHRFGVTDKLGSNPTSPGLPPLQFGFFPTLCDNGLDSNLVGRVSRTMSSSAHGDDVEPPAPTPKTSFFTLPSICDKEAPAAEPRVAGRPGHVDDGLLMSPRAETMTNNPLHSQFAEYSSLCFAKVPPTPSVGDLFSPRESVFPQHSFFPPGRPKQVDDPRSPPTKGEAPIVRSIDDLI